MKTRVAVVGGGITGLSCAYELGKQGVDCILLEGAERAGGKVLSPKSGRLILDAGPDSFLTTKPWALELIEELGLSGSLLATNSKRKTTAVYSGGCLRDFPDGLLLMAPTKIWPFLKSDLLSWPAKLRMGLDFVLPAHGKVDDESIAQFARRRFGDEAMETFIAPILAGIHSGDAERLSMKSTFPRFIELERKYGSVARGMRKAAGKRPAGVSQRTMFMTLSGGIEMLTRALSEKTAGALRLNASVSAVHGSKNNYRLETTAGPVEAEAVVVAAPADKAGKFLAADFGPLSVSLGAIEFAHTGTAVLVYSSDRFQSDFDGFGFVVDRRSRQLISGATYSSVKFPGRMPLGSVVVRCFFGGAGRAEDFEGDDADILARVRSDLASMAGLTSEPAEAHVFRWPSASPQYTVGHEERLAAIEGAVPEGMVLAGSSYRGIGLPDCIRSGREAARFAMAGGRGRVV